MTIIRCLLLILFFQASAIAQTENEWSERIAKTLPDAKLQTTLYDGTRPDILWDEYAIEVDWASKWAEGVGQALFYAKITNKKPVVLLLTKHDEDWRNDRRYINRALVALPRESEVWWYDCKTGSWLAEMKPDAKAYEKTTSSD